LPWARH